MILSDDEETDSEEQQSTPVKIKDTENEKPVIAVPIEHIIKPTECNTTFQLFLNY